MEMGFIGVVIIIAIWLCVCWSIGSNKKNFSELDILIPDRFIDDNGYGVVLEFNQLPSIVTLSSIGWNLQDKNGNLFFVTVVKKETTGEGYIIARPFICPTFIQGNQLIIITNAK